MGEHLMTALSKYLTAQESLEPLLLQGHSTLNLRRIFLQIALLRSVMIVYWTYNSDIDILTNSHAAHKYALFNAKTNETCNSSNI